MKIAENENYAFKTFQFDWTNYVDKFIYFLLVMGLDSSMTIIIVLWGLLSTKLT